MVKLMAKSLHACNTMRSLASVVIACMAVGPLHVRHQLATMGKPWSVIVRAMAHASQ